MRPRPGIEHHGRLLVGGRVDPAQHLVLGVGLAHLDVEAEVLAGRLAEVDQPRIRRQPVDVHLAGAEAAQVGSIEDVHLHASTSL
jgi:hypothetical protein